MSNINDKNKEKSQVEKAEQDPFTVSNPDGQNPKTARMLNVSYENSSFGGESSKTPNIISVSYESSTKDCIKRRWYFYIPAILLIIFVVLIELFHSIFK